MIGTFNCAVIETTPGADPADPFCPPEGFDGTVNEYVGLVRHRYRSDKAIHQRILVTAWYAVKPPESVCNPTDIRGPYADAVRRILQRLIRPSSNVAA